VSVTNGTSAPQFAGPVPRRRRGRFRGHAVGDADRYWHGAVAVPSWNDPSGEVMRHLPAPGAPRPEIADRHPTAQW